MTNENATAPVPFAGATSVRVRAVLVGEWIDVRALETKHRFAVSPLVVPAGKQGCVVLFRFGGMVFFNVQEREQASFLFDLKEFIHEAYPAPETEETTIAFEAVGKDRVDDDGTLMLQQADGERVQLVADILAKSVVLAHYESSIAEVFDQTEPLAADLKSHGKCGRGSRELLAQIGGTLLVQHKTVGRVAVAEKPDLLWERPDLERLYARLENEYELAERQAALERKLEVISRTAASILDLLHHRRSLRVEWYIVVLILVEIMLTLYQMFWSKV